MILRKSSQIYFCRLKSVRTLLKELCIIFTVHNAHLILKPLMILESPKKKTNKKTEAKFWKKQN